MKGKIIIQLYNLDWKKLRDEIINKVHKSIPRIKMFVKENFDLKREILKDLIAFAYLRSAINYRDLITQGIRKESYSDIRNLLEDFGYSFIFPPIDTKAFQEFCNEFRYKNEGEIFHKFLTLVVEEQSKIRDALVDVKVTYIL